MRNAWESEGKKEKAVLTGHGSYDSEPPPLPRPPPPPTPTWDKPIVVQDYTPLQAAPVYTAQNEVKENIRLVHWHTHTKNTWDRMITLSLMPPANIGFEAAITIGRCIAQWAVTS